ncbi:MAG: hydroxyacid dehydrogenase [Rhodospirillaceae bacterium]|nr:hydroxyacid dehydrogenase [Rhodospirillaceae bacterium]
MAERPKILLTSPVHPDAQALLDRHAETVIAPDTSGATLNALVGDVDGILVRNKLPDDICDHAPALRGMVRHGVGLDFIPVAAATARGIPVANLPGINARTVAEYCIAAVQHLRRPIVHMDRDLRADGWEAARAPAPGFVEMGGATIGIVGVGSIGRAVATIAGQGFGMTVLGASRRPGRMPEGVEETPLDDLFRRADAVILCCPLTDDTLGLVDARRLALMQPTAVLVNVSRGAVVVTDDLIAALKDGVIAGAATDVYDHHPLAPDHPLLDCPNILLTPHVAGITATSTRAMGMRAAEDLLRILRGEAPDNLVNPEYRDATTG